MEEGRADGAATFLLRQSDVRLGERGGVDFSSPHERVEPVARAVGGAAELDHVARQEALQHVQRDIVGAEIERHADGLVGELLRREHRRIRRHHERGVGHDGATAELAAARARLLHAAVIAPLAGIVHVRLALLEQLAVAGKGIDALRAGDVGLDLLLDALLAVGPLDDEPLLLEQTLVIGDEAPAVPGTGQWFPERASSWVSPGPIAPGAREASAHFAPQACRPQVVPPYRLLTGAGAGFCSCARNGTSGCAPIFTIDGRSSLISASR